MRAAAIVLVLLTGCGDDDGPSGLPAADLGGEVSLAVDGAGRTMRLARRGETLLVLPADALQVGTVDQLDGRLSYDPTAMLPASLRWRTATSFTITSADAARAEIALGFGGGVTGTLVLAADTRGAPGRISATLTLAGASAVAFTRVRARADATEGFYGLGEWPDSVNQRGKLRPMQLQPDLMLEGSSNENHVPVPLLVGTRGWGIFVESRRVGAFDVARAEPDLIEITYGTAESSAQPFRWHLLAADDPPAVVALYHAITGLPSLPAPWATGPWIWRDESRDQAEVEADIRQIRDLDLATSAIWIDRPYASGVNSFDFKPAQFPDPPAMIAAAHAAGLRVALWHTPYLATDAEPLRAEAAAAGYFPPQTGILLNSWSKPIDFTNPAAYAWWQGKIRQYAALGIEGYKLDYGEDIVPGAGATRNVWQFADGSDERTMHHGYTLLYHRVYAETLPASGGFLLGRAGRWGDQKSVSVIWPGDMDATFTRFGEPIAPGSRTIGVGGLPATVIQGQTLSASGFPLFGADTGGYRHSPPGKELYIRWFEQTALMPVMQVGDSSSQPPWVFTADNGRDQETLDLYRQYARLHLRLFPYLWTLTRAVASGGGMVVRPLGLLFPALGHPDDVYLLGDALLVAPVVEAGATRRRLTLPPGDWYDFFDGQKYSGAVDVAAPLGKLPLFARAGAVVPMLRPTIDTLAPATLAGVESYADAPGQLWVRLWPGDGGFLLWDGARVRREGALITLEDGSTFTRGFRLELLHAGRPAEVSRNGATVPEVTSLDSVTEGWLMDGDSLWIRSPAGRLGIQ